MLRTSVLCNRLQRILQQQAESVLGLSPLHEGLSVALRQEHLWSGLNGQSRNYRDIAAGSKSLAGQRPARSLYPGRERVRGRNVLAPGGEGPRRQEGTDGRLSRGRSSPFYGFREGPPPHRPRRGTLRRQSLRPVAAEQHTESCAHPEAWKHRRLKPHSARQQYGGPPTGQSAMEQRRMNGAPCNLKPPRLAAFQAWEEQQDQQVIGAAQNLAEPRSPAFQADPGQLDLQLSDAAQHLTASRSPAFGGKPEQPERHLDKALRNRTASRLPSSVAMAEQLDQQLNCAAQNLSASGFPAFEAEAEHEAGPVSSGEALQPGYQIGQDVIASQIERDAPNKNGGWVTAAAEHRGSWPEGVPRLQGRKNSGNLQYYILWHAEEACKQGNDAAVVDFLIKMREVLDQKSPYLSWLNITSMFHRCAKVVNATIQAQGQRYGVVEGKMVENPTLIPLLERLAALLVPTVPNLGTMALCNIYWALGVLRLSPADGKLLDAMEARLMELAKNGVYPLPMGIGIIFWACANLKQANLVDPEELVQTLSMHIVQPEVLATIEAINFSHIWWSCGVIQIDPCNGFLLAELSHGTTAKAKDFTMQGCTNVLWGLAKQDAKRAQLVQGKGQIFKDMADALLQQSRRQMRKSLPVNLSTLSWALGTLNYHPGRDYIQAMVDTLIGRGLLDEFDSQKLCNMIWGMARLGEHPGPVMMAKFLQKVDELLNADTLTHDDRDQGISNTLWSLTVLDELRPGFVERAYKQLPEKFSSELSKCQLYQCHMYLEAAMPPGKAPRMPHRLLEDCREAWGSIRDCVSVSYLQLAIHGVMRDMGLDVAMEYNEGLFSVDLALFLQPTRPGGERRKVAVEADGMTHYTCNQPLVDGRRHYMPLGRTLIRNKLLRARGWHVVDVPWFEWNALETVTAKRAYLEAAIALELQTSKTHQGLHKSVLAA